MFAFGSDSGRPAQAPATDRSGHKLPYLRSQKGAPVLNNSLLGMLLEVACVKVWWREQPSTKRHKFRLPVNSCFGKDGPKLSTCCGPRHLEVFDDSRPVSFWKHSSSSFLSALRAPASPCFSKSSTM